MATILDLTQATTLATTDETIVETASGPRAVPVSVLDDRYGARLITLVTSAGSRTLQLSDADAHIRVTATGTVTVPPNSSVAFPVGTSLTVERAAGTPVSIAAGSGVTIRAYPGLSLAGQYAVAALIKIGTDEWLASGALSA